MEYNSSLGFSGPSQAITVDSRPAIIFPSNTYLTIVTLNDGRSSVLSCGTGYLSNCQVSPDSTRVAVSTLGTEPNVSLWDLSTRECLWTSRTPLSFELISICFSPSGNSLAGLCRKEGHHVISIWEVSSGIVKSIGSFDHADPQSEIVLTDDFGPAITTGKHSVIFWGEGTRSSLANYTELLCGLKIAEGSSNIGTLSCSIGEFQPSDFHTKLGLFNQSVFVGGSVYTGTTEGSLLVWQVTSSESQGLKAIRAVSINQGVEVSSVCSVGGLVVVGCADGSIRVYDQQSKIVDWFEVPKDEGVEFLGGVLKISFETAAGNAANPESSADQMKGDTQVFSRGSFKHSMIVSTSNGIVARVIPTSSSSPASGSQSSQKFPEKHFLSGARCFVLAEGFDGRILDIVTFDAEHILVMSAKSVRLINWKKKQFLWKYVRRQIDAVNITAMSIYKNSLCIGFSNGYVEFFNASIADALEDEASSGSTAAPSVTSFVSSHSLKSGSRGGIQFVRFSPDGSIVLAAQEKGISVFCENWLMGVFIPKNQTMIDMQFITEEKFTVLFSDGKIEISSLQIIKAAPNALNSAPDVRVQIIRQGMTTVEGVTRGMCVCVSAHSEGGEGVVADRRADGLLIVNHRQSTNFQILAIDDDSKWRVFLEEGESEISCFKVTKVTPSDAIKVRQLKDGRFLFSDISGSVGLVCKCGGCVRMDAEPLDKFTIPYKSVIEDLMMREGGSVGEEPVASLNAGTGSASTDQQKEEVFVLEVNEESVVFTGGSSQVLTIWNLRPFLNCECGLADSRITDHHTMKRLFYLSEIRAKGENQIMARPLDGTIPFSEIHRIFSAMGYYPSQWELNNMHRQLIINKHDLYIDVNQEVLATSADVCFLFENYRPVKGQPVDREQLKRALSALQSRGVSLVEVLTRRTKDASSGSMQAFASVEEAENALRVIGFDD